MTDVFDVVNLCDQVVGSYERDKVHKFNLFHRAVHILVFRPNGRLIIQQRSAKKDYDPFLWTSSCSGHVDCGEDYSTAAIRECKEELGQIISDLDLKEILRLSPCIYTGNEFVRVYFTHNSNAMYFNRNEIVQLKEESITEIYRLVNTSPEIFSKSFIHIFCLLKSRLLHERYLI